MFSRWLSTISNIASSLFSLETNFNYLPFDWWTCVLILDQSLLEQRSVARLFVQVISGGQGFKGWFPVPGIDRILLAFFVNFVTVWTSAPPYTTRPCLHWDAPREQEPKVVSWRMHRRRPKKLKRRPKKLNRHHVALPPEPNPPQLSVRLSPRNPRLDITLYHRSIVHCWKRLLLNTNTFHPQKAYANNCIWSNSGTALLKRTPNGWHRTLWRFSVTCVRWHVLLWHFISTVHFPTGIGWSPRLCCVRIKRPMDRTGHKRDAYGVVQPWVNCLTTE